MEAVKEAIQQIYDLGDPIVEYKVTVQYKDKSWLLGKESIVSMTRRRNLFSSDKPMIGCVCSAELEVELMNEAIYNDIRYYGDNTDRITLIPQVTVTSYDRFLTQTKRIGYFYSDSVEIQRENYQISIHAYDVLHDAESTRIYDFITTHAVTPGYGYARAISALDGAENDQTSYLYLHSNHILDNGGSDALLGVTGNTTVKDILSQIAIAHIGNFVCSDKKIVFLPLGDVPPDSSYLINEKSKYITFGGDRVPLVTR